MKNFNLLKTLQMILFILLGAISLFVVFTDKELYHQIATNPHIKFLCCMLWLVLILSFLFLFIDYNQHASFKREYLELNHAMHSDPMSGIANRYSCDALIEKYYDKPLPSNIGCVMLELTNIVEINKLYGHDHGNELIRNFSNILKLTSVNLCFVGRNGGNKFLAIFEDGSQEKIDTFLARVEQKMKVYNADADNHPAEYHYGAAFSGADSVTTINELIALSDSRLSGN